MCFIRSRFVEKDILDQLKAKVINATCKWEGLVKATVNGKKKRQKGEIWAEDRISKVQAICTCSS